MERVAAPATAESIDTAVLEIFEMVKGAVNDATTIFLQGDRVAARGLSERDQLIDNLHARTERTVRDMVLRADGLSLDSRDHLLTVLGILPELERSGDLAEHIACHAGQGLAQWLTPRARNLVAQMGELASELWRLAAAAYAARDGSAAGGLRRIDDELDDLHVTLTAELASSGVSVPVAIEMALVARFFERLGDHAVNITRRLPAGGAELREATWAGR